MKDENYTDEDFELPPITPVSKCCNAASLTELYETKLGNLVGRCSTCKEVTIFEPEIPNEYNY